MKTSKRYIVHGVADPEETRKLFGISKARAKVIYRWVDEAMAKAFDTWRPSVQEVRIARADFVGGIVAQAFERAFDDAKTRRFHEAWDRVLEEARALRGPRKGG